jgi:hypothetical protein
VDVVWLLLEAEANMNVKAKATAQSQTYTPLGIAKDKGHAQVVALLEEARGKERTARAQVAERERMEREQKRAKWIEGVRACLPDKLDPNAIYRVVEDRGRFRLQKTLKCQPGEVAFLAEVFVPCGAAFVSAPGELSGTVLSLRQLQLVPREGLVEAVEPPVTADTQADVEPKAKDRDYATAGGASVVVTENGLEFRSGTQNGEPIQWVFEGANPNLHVSTAGAQGEAATEDSPAVPDLIAALSDDHARETSIAALAKIGSAAVPGLIEVLRNPAPSASEADVRTRGAIIETLGRIGSTAVPDLISTFSHGASDVRSDAVLAFAWMGPQAGAAVPLLIDVLKHEDENVRVSAVTALGEIGPEAKAAVPHLVELLADPNPTVRTSANLALARIRQDVEALVHLLRKRGDDNTRAHVSLLSIGADAVPSLCNAMEAIGASVTTTEEIAQVMGVLTTLSQISRSEPTTMRHSVPCLLRAARRMTSTTMRTSIVEGIATLFGPPAVPYILAFLQSEWEKPPDIDSNLTVTQGLISYIFINMVEADAANVDPLLEAVRPTLRSSRGSFKEAVILIVGNLSPSTNRVIPFLQHELDSETEPEIRKRLRQAIDSAKQRMKP